MPKRKQNTTDSEAMREIRNLENKYGLALFRIGLTHLIDVGVRNLTDENVEAGIAKIMAEKGTDNESTGNPIITPEFQCHILRCARELAQFGIFDLLRYIKRHVVID